MACNFLRSFMLPCFGCEPDNPNVNGNMCSFLHCFRMLIPCFGGDPESLETSIQDSGGNMFGKYYWQSRLAHHLYGRFSMAGPQTNLQIEDHSQVVSGGDTENLETSIQGSSGNTFSELGLARHLYGVFSMAGVGQPANFPNNDRSQLVSGTLTEQEDGPRGVFVGIYDGHGGTTCSQFLLDLLFPTLKSAIANENGVINAEVLEEAYYRTELMFVNHVRSNWHNKPQLAVLGSCCLVGVVFNNVLYVANTGDSRAVLARWPNGGGLDDMEVIQLSVDYNAKHIERRNEVCAVHTDTNLFPEGDGCFLLRGSLHVTRAIGNVYLKYNEFNEEPLPAQYIQEELIVRPILKAEPMIRTHQLGPDDRFVIFASHGFWDEINNEEAADFVRNFNRNGAAAMLMRKALERAASKHGIGYYDLRYFDPGAKRQYHDDISVVILFFDSAFLT